MRDQWSFPKGGGVAKGGVAKLISVNLASLGLWECKPLADCWAIWLRELETFAQIPLFFQLFLKHQKCRDGSACGGSTYSVYINNEGNAQLN